MPDVIFTEEKLKRFKKRYAEAVKKKEGSFTFDGHGYVTGYAKYLIEYLERLRR